MRMKAVSLRKKIMEVSLIALVIMRTSNSMMMMPTLLSLRSLLQKSV